MSAEEAKSVHNEYLQAQFDALPKLPPFTKLGPRVWRVLGGNPSVFHLQGTNTYIVGTGKERILIDAGEGHPDWKSTLKYVLDANKIHIKTALITHWHHDHTGGIPDLLEISPDTIVHKHKPTDSNQHDIKDGEVFKVEGATLRAVFTPGHTNDHMCFYLEEERSLFAGDNVLGHGTTVFEELGEYMKSLDIMHGLVEGGPKKKLYPGHGELVQDAARKIEEYRMHRRRREQQILGCLKEVEGKGGANGGKATSLELVREIYVDADESLWKAAEGGTVQVLEKLEREGRVGVEGEEGGERRWFLK